MLFKTTGDPVWRDRAWEIFEAIRKHARVDSNGEEVGGYASVMMVNTEKPAQTNSMPRLAIHFFDPFELTSLNLNASFHFKLVPRGNAEVSLPGRDAPGPGSAGSMGVQHGGASFARPAVEGMGKGEVLACDEAHQES